MSASVLQSAINGIRATHRQQCKSNSRLFADIGSSTQFGPIVANYLRLLGNGAWRGCGDCNGLQQFADSHTPEAERAVCMLFWNFFCPGSDSPYLLSLFPDPTLDSGGGNDSTDPRQRGIELYQTCSGDFERHNLRSFHHAIGAAADLLGVSAPHAPSCLLLMPDGPAVSNAIGRIRGWGMAAVLVEETVLDWLRGAVAAQGAERGYPVESVDRSGRGAPASSRLPAFDQTALLKELGELINETNVFFGSHTKTHRDLATELVKIVGGRPDDVSAIQWRDMEDLAAMFFRYLAWMLWCFPNLGAFVYVPGTSGSDAFLRMGCSIGFESYDAAQLVASLDAIAQSVAAAEAVFYFTIQEAASPFERCVTNERQENTAANFSHELKRVSANLANLAPDPSSSVCGRPLVRITTASNVDQYIAALHLSGWLNTPDLPRYGTLLLNPGLSPIIRDNIGLCFYPQGIRDIASLMALWCQAYEDADLRKLLGIKQGVPLADVSSLLERAWSCSLRLLPLAGKRVVDFAASVPDTGSAALESELKRYTEIAELAGKAGLAFQVCSKGPAEATALSTKDKTSIGWLGRALLALLRDYAMHTRPPQLIAADVSSKAPVCVEIQSLITIRITVRDTGPDNLDRTASIAEFANVQSMARNAGLYGNKSGIHTQQVVDFCMKELHGGAAFDAKTHSWTITCRLKEADNG